MGLAKAVCSLVLLHVQVSGCLCLFTMCTMRIVDILSHRIQLNNEHGTFTRQIENVYLGKYSVTLDRWHSIFTLRVSDSIDA